MTVSTLRIAAPDSQCCASASTAATTSDHVTASVVHCFTAANYPIRRWLDPFSAR